MNEINTGEAELRLRRKRVDPERAKSLDLAKAELDWWTTALENGDATSSLVQLKADGTREGFTVPFVALPPHVENAAASESPIECACELSTGLESAGNRAGGKPRLSAGCTGELPESTECPFHLRCPA